MNKDEQRLSIRRILVALDASPHSMAALDAAIALAAHFRAELLGIFVEDINLLRLAELPFAYEVGAYSATRRRLDVPHVEKELRAQAEQVHRKLKKRAERARIKWTFQVTRGTVATELLSHASKMDLIILGKAGWSPKTFRHVGSTAQAILAESPCAAMLLQDKADFGLHIYVTYEETAPGRRSLAAAAALASIYGSQLTILIPEDSPDKGRDLQSKAAAWIKTQARETEYRLLQTANAYDLAQKLQAQSCGILVLPRESAVVKGDLLIELLKELRIPVFLVR